MCDIGDTMGVNNVTKHAQPRKTFAGSLASFCSDKEYLMMLMTDELPTCK